jgi:hypothetical protein
MSKDLIRTFKFFWPDQDREQELWLRAQARAGLHLVGVNVLCTWTFRRGAPADVAYRVDFTDKGRDPLYRQLFADAGWERAAEVTGWQYWRKAVTTGAAPEIFTDNASKVAKFRRLIALCALGISPMLITGATLIPARLAQMSPPTMVGIIAVYTLLPLIYAIMALRLFKRMRELSPPAAS